MGKIRKIKEFFYTFKLIRQTRNIQEYLWGKHNDSWGFEEWKRMFRKRVDKIEKIDMKNPHWKIELRKRLLQNACISISLLGRLGTLKDISTTYVPSNLEEYKNNKTIIDVIFDCPKNCNGKECPPDFAWCRCRVKRFSYDDEDGLGRI